jgi:hypothetical protein
VLGFELKTSCMQGGCSTTWATPLSPFCFGYFWDRISCFCSADLDHGPPLYASCVAGMAGAHHCNWLLVEMGVSLTFCRGWHWTLILPVSFHWVTGIIGVSHLVWPDRKLLLRSTWHGHSWKLTFVSLVPGDWILCHHLDGQTRAIIFCGLWECGSVKLMYVTSHLVNIPGSGCNLSTSKPSFSAVRFPNLPPIP